LIVLCAFVSACDKANTAETSPGSSAKVATSVVAPPATAPALPAALPADIDVAALKKKLGCDGARRQVCRVLGEFSDADRFAPQIPSGEGRFIGTAYTVEKGTEKSDLLLVFATIAPTATVPPGELPLRVGTGPVPDDKRDHGVKFAAALARGDVAPKTNQAAPYVKAWKATDARGTINTTGNSVRLVSEEMYIRQTKTKVLTVRVRRAPGGAEETTVAELWAASW
jgi:hypothetical protein